VGSILFGLGWGLGGLCTASFYVLIPLANIKVQVYWGVSCLLGFSVVGIINRFLGIFKKSK
jgi:uncharacterized membrane protein YedE/YeeE